MVEKLIPTPGDIAPRVARKPSGVKPPRGPESQSTTEPEKFPALDEAYKLRLDGASIEDVKKAVHGKRFQSRDGRIVTPTGEYLELGGKQSFKIDEEGPGDTVTAGRMDVQELAENFIEIDEHDQAVEQHDSQPGISSTPNSHDQASQISLDPEHTTQNQSLRDIVSRYNAVKMPQGNNPVTLGELEKWALSGDESDATKIQARIGLMEQNARPDAEDVEAYLEALRAAAEKKRSGEDVPEISKYLADDLNRTRYKLAEQTYKRINSPIGFNMLRLPKAKEELEDAQAAYDESLRTYGQWMVAGLEPDASKQMTAELAVAEMINLRAFIDSELQSTGKSAQESNASGNLLNKGKEFNIRGKKRRITLGHVATAAVGGGIGLGARLVAGATVAPLVASAIGGGIAGGVMGGVRAHKDTKSGLSEVSDTEKADLEKHVTTENLDRVLRSHLSAEVEKATKERWIKIGKRALKGAGVGAAIGLAGATAGVAVGAGIDYLANGDVTHAEGAAGYGTEPNPGPGEAPVDDSTGLESGEEVPEMPEETTSFTTEELLHEHAGDTSEAATTIESGEGAYQTFEELGIPKDQWAELLHNDELMDKLIANGDAYEMGQEGFGLSHEGSLSGASIHDIYEAAGVDTFSAAEATTTEADAPIYDDLPESYGELPENIQEFAHNHSVVADIPNGMGGEQLLNQLGVESSEWYKFEEKLLATAPDDFYRMPDGHVGLKHPGALSADGLKAIATEISRQGYALR